MTKIDRLGEPEAVHGDETLDLGTLTAEDLKGAKVYDRHEGTVGTVADVVTSKDGKVENLVMDVGGFLGIASHSVGIGGHQVSLRHGRDGDVRIYLKMTEEELRDLPARDAPLIPPAAAGFRN
jgi:hypothetical protein